MRWRPSLKPKVNQNESSQSTSRTDLLLSRASHVSQVVLVVVAIFGYFYTVRPIYQKDRLEEKNAKLEKEYEKKQEWFAEQLTAKEAFLMKVSGELEAVTRKLDTERRELQKATADRDRVRLEVAEMKQLAQRHYTNLRTVSAESFTYRASVNCLQARSGEPSSTSGEDYRKPKLEEFVACVQKELGSYSAIGMLSITDREKLRVLVAALPERVKAAYKRLTEQHEKILKQYLNKLTGQVWNGGVPNKAGSAFFTNLMLADRWRQALRLALDEMVKEFVA
jgi:hypothetical protein